MSTTAVSTKSQPQTKTDKLHSADTADAIADAIAQATANAAPSFVKFGTNYTFSSAAADGAVILIGSPSDFDDYGAAVDDGSPTITTTPNDCNPCGGNWTDDPSSTSWSSPTPTSPVAANITLGGFQAVKLTYVKSFGGTYLIPPGHAPEYEYTYDNIGISVPLNVKEETSTRTLISTSDCDCDTDDAGCLDFGQWEPGSASSVAEAACGAGNYTVFTTNHPFNSKAPNGTRVAVGVLTCESYYCCASCADFAAFDTEAEAASSCEDGKTTSCTFSANSPSAGGNVSCVDLQCYCCY